MKDGADKYKGIKRIRFLIISSLLVFLIAWLTGSYSPFNIAWLNELTVLALMGLSIIGFMVGSALWLTFCRPCRECKTVWICNFDIPVDDE